MIFRILFTSFITVFSHATVNSFSGVKSTHSTVENGQSKVFFEEPLQHNPIGTYVPSSGWRFLIFNNLALLDMPGEYVCVDLGDSQGGNSVDILDFVQFSSFRAGRADKY